MQVDDERRCHRMPRPCQQPVLPRVQISQHYKDGYKGTLYCIKCLTGKPLAHTVFQERNLMGDRIDNNILLNAGLELMRQNGKPLTKQAGYGRSMRYVMPKGESVRVRTCNDHVLIVVADSPDPDKATLNIEGTDWILIVMPEVERQMGKVFAYLVPTRVAVETVRQCHREWLATNPNTAGSNTTFNIWFEEGGKSSGFARKWQQYLLHGEAEIKEPVATADNATTGSIKHEVEMARQRIARAAGVSTSAVRISVDFGV